MIALENGLINSQKVLRFLRKDKELRKKPYYIIVGTFTNCRECGFTFKATGKDKAFTWCIYEHRNSDDIIINGKEGYISENGELPYNGESKYSYLLALRYDKHQECAEELAKRIKEWYKLNT
jgi:hypothetical protein